MAKDRSRLTYLSEPIRTMKPEPPDPNQFFVRFEINEVLKSDAEKEIGERLRKAMQAASEEFTNALKAARTKR